MAALSSRRLAGSLGLGFVACYVAAALGVHHCYPLYVFDMYAYAPSGTVASVRMELAGAGVVPVTAFRAVSCDKPLSEVLAALRDFTYDTIQARENEYARWLEAHWTPAPVPGAVPANLVRARWSLEAPDASRPAVEKLFACEVLR